jgi:hypothetical protein
MAITALCNNKIRSEYCTNLTKFSNIFLSLLNTSRSWMVSGIAEVLCCQQLRREIDKVLLC